MTRFWLATVVMLQRRPGWPVLPTVPRAESPEDFAIMAWSWVSDDADALRKRCANADSTWPVSSLPRVSDAVAAAGLKAIVSDGAYPCWR